MVLMVVLNVTLLVRKWPFGHSQNFTVPKQCELTWSDEPNVLDIPKELPVQVLWGCDTPRTVSGRSAEHGGCVGAFEWCSRPGMGMGVAKRCLWAQMAECGLSYC